MEVNETRTNAIIIFKTLICIKNSFKYSDVFRSCTDGALCSSDSCRAVPIEPCIQVTSFRALPIEPCVQAMSFRAVPNAPCVRGCDARCKRKPQAFLLFLRCHGDILVGSKEQKECQLYMREMAVQFNPSSPFDNT